MNTEDKFRQPHLQQEVPQYYHYPPQHHMPQQGGDELGLMQLWKVLRRYKWSIIFITALSTLGAGYYVSTLPTIYRAEVLMVSAGGGGGSGLSEQLGGLASLAGIGIEGGGDMTDKQALAKLKTRSFLMQHVEEYNLKPILFAERWNQHSQEWLDDEPSSFETYNLFNDMVYASTDKSGITKLQIEWKNPSSIARISDIANTLVTSLNKRAKIEAKFEAEKSILFLQAELERTTLIHAQEVLYRMIEIQMQNIMMANVRDEVVFKVIDPAVVPESAEVKPVFMIVLLGLVLGLTAGVIIAVSVRYIGEQVENERSDSV